MSIIFLAVDYGKDEEVVLVPILLGGLQVDFTIVMEESYHKDLDKKVFKAGLV